MRPRRPSGHDASPCATSRGAVLLVLAGLGTALGAGCGPAKPLQPIATSEATEPARGCDALASGNFAALSATPQQRSYLEATHALALQGSGLGEAIAAGCAAIGRALGAPAGAPSDGPRPACGAVVARIGAIRGAAPGSDLDVRVARPRCFVDVDAANACWGECDAAVPPEELSPSCKGGEISGRCDGACRGSCAVRAGSPCAGACAGSCTGACDGGFDGTCGGACVGACDGQPSRGTCGGRCEGRCDERAVGRCDGTCTGTCDAPCEVPGQARCDGVCAGGCDAPLASPVCSGELAPAGVDLGCQATCGVGLLRAVGCLPARVEVEVTGSTDADVARLGAALEASLPDLARLELGLGPRTRAAAAAMVAQGEGQLQRAAGSDAPILACLEAAHEMNEGLAAGIAADLEAAARVVRAARGEVRAAREGASP